MEMNMVTLGTGPDVTSTVSLSEHDIHGLKNKQILKHKSLLDSLLLVALN